MLIMGVYLVIVQVHRSGGAVMATALMDTRGYRTAELGTMMGSMFLAAAMVQLPAGVLYDRYGTRVMLATMNLIAVVGILVFAMAGSVSAMTFGRTLIGIGHGTVIAGIYLLAVAWAPPERVATVSATVIGLAGGLGALLATTPLSIALERAGFAPTFVVVALLTLAFSAAIFLMVRDAPADHAELSGARGVESFWQSLRGLWEVANDRNLWPIFVMGTCFTAPFLTIGGLWAGPYLRDVHGLGAAEASYVILAMMAALYVGYMSYGPLDRVFDTRKWVVLGGVAGMLLTLTALVAMPGLPLPAVVVLLVTFSFCSPFFVTLAAHCRGFVPVHRVGRAIACINLMGLVSVFVMQALTGMMVEGRGDFMTSGSESGYRLVFATVALVLLVAAAVYTRVRDVPATAAPPR
jgi:predicted MFS family arabinose efflux permease